MVKRKNSCSRQRFDAKDLCKKITGEELNFKYFMKYAQEKHQTYINLKFLIIKSISFKYKEK